MTCPLEAARATDVLEQRQADLLTAINSYLGHRLKPDTLDEMFLDFHEALLVHLARSDQEWIADAIRYGGTRHFGEFITDPDSTSGEYEQGWAYRINPRPDATEPN